MDGCQSAAPRPLLFAEVSGVSGWFGKNSPLGQENNVFTRQFLLEFPHKATLNLVVNLLLWERNVDYYCYLKRRINSVT